MIASPQAETVGIGGMSHPIWKQVSPFAHVAFAPTQSSGRTLFVQTLSSANVLQHAPR